MRGKLARLRSGAVHTFVAVFALAVVFFPGGAPTWTATAEATLFLLVVLLVLAEAASSGADVIVQYRVHRRR